MNRKYPIAAAAIAIGLLTTGAACTSDADTVNENIITAAENFEVNRRIVVVNNITDTVLYEVEGRCSIERDGSRLFAICKHGPDDFRKQEVGLADNVSYVSTQLEGADVDEYSTRIIFKPQGIVPNYDMLTGEAE